MLLRAVSNAVKRAAGVPAVLIAVAAVVPLPGSDGSRLLGLPSLCPFHYLTGYPCPACGITRALVCAAHGHGQESLRFHPLGLSLLFALLTALLWRVFLPSQTFPVRVEKALYKVGLVAVLGIWVLRLTGVLSSPP